MQARGQGWVPRPEAKQSKSSSQAEGWLQGGHPGPSGGGPLEFVYMYVEMCHGHSPGLTVNPCLGHILPPGQCE